MIKINKILYTLLFLLVVATIVLYGLWTISKNNLEHTKNDLTNANNTILTLQTDNDNLLTYNLKKEQELKQLKSAYKQSLENIPADKCGDAKPSKELLEYFKKAKNK